jgi:hypothetical protein
MSTQTKFVLAGLAILVIVFLFAYLGILPSFNFGEIVNNAIATLPPVQ